MTSMWVTELSKATEVPGGRPASATCLPAALQAATVPSSKLVTEVSKTTEVPGGRPFLAVTKPDLNSTLSTHVGN